MVCIILSLHFPQILFCRHFLAFSTLLDSFVISGWFSAILLLCCLDDFIICHILFHIGVYSGFGLLGFWQATAIKYKRFGSYADGKCSVVCFHSWWASVFYNRQENCQLLFPVPTSDIFKQDCSSDLQDCRLLVWVGYPWCLEFKRKFLLILSINLLTCVFCFSMYLMNLFNFEVNIFFLLKVLNDYLTFSLVFTVCLFFPKPVHMITITLTSQRTSCQVLLLK